MSKVTLLAAAAVGYVLGSRAGRGHYEIVKDQALKLWQTPQVQEAANQATEAARDAAEQVKDKASEATGQNGTGQSSNGQSSNRQSNSGQNSGGRHSADQVQPPSSQFPPSGGGDGTAPS
ncbi:hypothetical protein G6027_01090 [Dietzia sp. SLG310A2-38A2]|uniref:YtxH domain-containing protein n=1 Tax=Dietzia sp. SLG310A2-38A2 TaxID=1630643 RepID=UPI0015FE52C7|nr:YtxH domain-containing protein [Dietzia sp. SLG310A2-38A2]MBB1029508.1 hypothetical protein [Dietzia sp. SLG310A2-38A2]